MDTTTAMNARNESVPKSEGRKSELRAEGHLPKHEIRNRACGSCARTLEPRMGADRPMALAGFTLIELLIVISIIAILASMIIPISGAVNRNKIRAKARVEFEQVATAIELYKAKMGHYPPDNPANPATNQLYFELLGTVFTNGVYSTLDGTARIYADDLGTIFGGTPPRVGGIINRTEGAGGDEGRAAASFVNGFKPGEIFTLPSPGRDVVKILVVAVPSTAARPISPISYVSSSPTNNPNSYDLWVDFVVSGKTNRLSNWNKEIVTLP